MAWVPKPSFAQEATAPLLALAPAIAALVLAFTMTQFPVASTDTPARPALTIAMPAAPSKPPPSTSNPNAYPIVRALTLDGPMKHGDYVWNEDGAPAGPILVTVDLKAQMMSVFRAGHEIGVAVIVYGADEKPTPLGIFPITEKDADHVSRTYGDAPMPYMLRLTDDGISIHGAKVDREWGTNGCIGVPVEFARRLFGQARLGDRVVITSGQMMRVGQSVPIA